jgi:oligopeptide/dipeptide ABC transporter ATP-binding protein
MTPLLSVQNLRTGFDTREGFLRAVDGISFEIPHGGTLGVVGESGSGKSVTALSVMRLIDRPGRIADGSHIVLDGRDLAKLEESELEKIRGNDVSMIFQEPMTSLNPVFTVGDQIAEAVQLHQSAGPKEAMDRAVEMMQLVGIPSPAQRVQDYPHQLSGGMRQRVMIAMALINGPALLIADEPTTALDVTVQAQILDLIGQLQSEFNTAVIVITHDLGIVADVADEVIVMYAARVVEQAPTDKLYASPEMPYTLGLLTSIPRMDRERTDRLDPIRGNPPSPLRHPAGCVFHPRCNYTDRVPGDACATVRPELLPSGPDHTVRCHIPPEERREIATALMTSPVAGHAAIAEAGGTEAVLTVGGAAGGSADQASGAPA